MKYQPPKKNTGAEIPVTTLPRFTQVHQFHQFTPFTPFPPGRVIDAQTFEQLMAFDPLGVGLVLARNDQKEVRQ